MASLIGAGLLCLLTVGPVRGFAFYLGLSTVLDLLTSYCLHAPGRAAGHAARSWLRRAPEPARPARRRPEQPTARGRAPTAADDGGDRDELARGASTAARPTSTSSKWWKRDADPLGRAGASSASLSLFTRGLNLGIDFEGGVSWEVSAPGVSVSEARDGARRRRRGRGQDPDRRHATSSGCRVRPSHAEHAGRGPPEAGRPRRHRRRRGQRQHRRPVVGQRDHQVGRCARSSSSSSPS